MLSILRVPATVLVALLVSSCATLAPQPREFKLSEAQLQELVGKRFAMAQKYLGVIDVRLTEPRVSLQPESNGVLTALDVSVDAPLIGRPWKGAVSISGRLRLDPSTKTILLEDPRTEVFRVEGVSAVYADRVNRIGGWLTEQVLKGFPVYALKAEDLRFDNVSYEPSDFRVKPGELAITLTPKPAR